MLALHTNLGEEIVIIDSQGKILTLFVAKSDRSDSGFKICFTANKEDFKILRSKVLKAMAEKSAKGVIQ